MTLHAQPGIKLEDFLDQTHAGADELLSLSLACLALPWLLDFTCLDEFSQNYPQTPLLGALGPVGGAPVFVAAMPDCFVPRGISTGHGIVVGMIGWQGATLAAVAAAFSGIPY